MLCLLNRPGAQGVRFSFKTCLLFVRLNRCVCWYDLLQYQRPPTLPAPQKRLHSERSCFIDLFIFPSLHGYLLNRWADYYPVLVVISRAGDLGHSNVTIILLTVKSERHVHVRG